MDPDPDPNQNDMDPKHWFLLNIFTQYNKFACLKKKQMSTEYNFRSLDSSQIVVKLCKTLKILKVCVKQV